MSDKQQLLGLIEVIEEQQELIKELLAIFPESSQKEEIRGAALRIRNKTQSAKRQLQFLTRNEGK